MNCTLRGRCFIADHILYEAIVVTGRDKHKILLQKCYLSMNFSTLLLIMEVDFCPVLCIPEVPVLQAFRGISHFVWYCKAVSDLS